MDDGDAGFSSVGAWTQTTGALTVPGDPASPLEVTVYNTAYGGDIHQVLRREPVLGSQPSAQRPALLGVRGTCVARVPRVAINLPLSLPDGRRQGPRATTQGERA